jgi:putative oxidoreductase
MFKLPDLSRRYTITFLRVITGIIFITHGAARLYYGTLPGFGEFLNSQGFIIGHPLAWMVTIGEIVSGSCLAAGYKIKLCTVFHVIVILTGIFLIHLPHGWFTVGQGSGGVEYSLLLLAVLIFLYSSAGSKTR